MSACEGWRAGRVMWGGVGGRVGRRSCLVEHLYQVGHELTCTNHQYFHIKGDRLAKCSVISHAGITWHSPNMGARGTCVDICNFVHCFVASLLLCRAAPAED